MKNRYAQISYLASGHIVQDILITDPNTTSESLMDMLNAGEAITTIHEGEGNNVVLTSDFETVIGTVISTEPEMDYTDFQDEGEYELVQPDVEPFDMTRLARACAIGEFIFEPEMANDHIIAELERAAGEAPKLNVEEGALDMSGRQLLKEIDLAERGLMNLMKLAYDAGKNGQEII